MKIVKGSIFTFLVLLSNISSFSQSGAEYFHGKDWEKTYRQKIEQNPNDLAPVEQMANALFLEGRYAEAITFFHKVKSKNPSSFKHQKKLGIAYLKINDLKNAQTYLLQSLDIDKKLASHKQDPYLNLYLGMLYFKLKDKKKADQYFLKLEQNSKPAQFLFEKGKFLSEEGLYQEAIEQFQKVLQLDQQAHLAYFEIAENYLLSGNPEIAKTHWKNFLDSTQSNTSELLKEKKLRATQMLKVSP